MTSLVAKFRRIPRTGLYGVLLVLAWLCPVNALRYRLLLCLAALLELFLVMRWVWPHRRLRIGVIGILMTVGLLLLSPSRPTDADVLRECYVDRLYAYEGVRYLWGGEGRFDCSCTEFEAKMMHNWALCGKNRALCKKTSDIATASQAYR